MDRFEIEDISSQDKSGVVFHAIDKESGTAVEILRFFPFGQNNGGLGKEEQIVHAAAVQRLSEIKHTALRSVIDGGTDPVDGIPFLVSQWIDGASLGAVLGNEKLDPGLVIDIIRLALEVSAVVSHLLGEEAVWVDTEIGSIVVGTEESARGFTFRLSPLKWLGPQTGGKNLSSVVALAEELTGWRAGKVADQAGYGLGGWLKWLKKNPDVALHEALESLAASTGNDPPQPVEEIVEQAVRPPGKAASGRSPSKKLLVSTALVAVAVLCGSLTYLHMTATPPEIAAEYSEQKISDIIVDSPAPSRQSARAGAPEMAPRLREEADAAAHAAIAESTSSAAKRGGAYSPDDTVLIERLPTGTSVKLRGKLASVRFSQSKKSLYLYFSDPYKNGQVRGVLHERDYKGEYAAEAFANLIGKEIILDGKFTTENTANPLLLKVTDSSQVRSVK